MSARRRPARARVASTSPATAPPNQLSPGATRRRMGWACPVARTNTGGWAAPPPRSARATTTAPAPLTGRAQSRTRSGVATIGLAV